MKFESAHPQLDEIHHRGRRHQFRFEGIYRESGLVGEISDRPRDTNIAPRDRHVRFVVSGKPTERDSRAGVRWATRRKTGVPVLVEKALSLRAALAALPRKHMCILTTEWGKPFTVDGFSGWMRAAMTEAGLPLDCRPHGLRKTFGRLLADAGTSAHDIMAALGHLTLAEAERYTREADRRHGGRRAIAMLEDHKANRKPQTSSASLGKLAKNKGNSK